MAFTENSIGIYDEFEKKNVSNQLFTFLTEALTLFAIAPLTSMVYFQCIIGIFCPTKL